MQTQRDTKRATTSPAGKTALPGFMLFLLLAAGLLTAWVTQPGRSDTALTPTEASPPPTAPPRTFKITLDEPGLVVRPYEISPFSLAGASIHPDTTQLTLRGEPIPFTITGTGPQARIQFHALPQPPDRYTAQTVYLLHLNQPPEEMAPTSAQPPAPPPPAFRFEQNLLYDPMARVHIPWFWLRLIAPTEQTLPFTLPAQVGQNAGPNNSSAELHLALWGQPNNQQINPDHRILAAINGELIGEFAWEGASLGQASFSIPPGILRAGENQFTLTLPGDTGADIDIQYLDAFTITFPNAALVDQAPRLVELQPLLEAPDLGNPSLAVDYLAVGPAHLLEPLTPLLDHHRAQGLTAQTIPIQAVYDQFGHGFSTPDALVAFLEHAWETWSTPPRYLLLVGDWTYDPLNYQPESAAANLLPAFFIYTLYGGETVTDLPYTLPDAEGLPQLAVGRIPAQTPEEVRIFVNKTLTFERGRQAKAEGPANWQHRILAVADNFETSFRGDAQAFLDLFPEEYERDLLAPAPGAAGVNEQIAERLYAGNLVFAYFGHGSLTQLGKERLFATQDAAALTNLDRLPIVLNITCLAGLYTHPRVPSLTETMLWNPAGGAVAALSATSLTTPTDQAVLTRAFSAALISPPNPAAPRLGDILLEAQRQALRQAPGVREVVKTFLLFGDPALLVE